MKNRISKMNVSDGTIHGRATSNRGFWCSTEKSWVVTYGQEDLVLGDSQTKIETCNARGGWRLVFV